MRPLPVGFVAYVDILGFSAMLQGDPEGAILEGYSGALRDSLSPKEPLGIEYVVFSDNIVVHTSNDSLEQLGILTRSIAKLYFEMIRLELPIRGAISHGKFRVESHSNGRIVYGQPILEAHHFEQQQDWLGIMLAPSVFRAIDVSRHALPEAPGLWGGSPFPIKRHLVPLKDGSFEGYAVVPSESYDTSQQGVLDSIHASLRRVERLKYRAPDSRAQAKYNQTASFLKLAKEHSGRGPRLHVG